MNSASADKLTGAAGADWFIISCGDTITDLHLGTTQGGQGDEVTYVD